MDHDQVYILQHRDGIIVAVAWTEQGATEAMAGLTAREQSELHVECHRVRE